MPKIAHFGDIHLRADGRFEDTLRCLDFAIDDGIAQGVDLWVIPGDLFDTKSVPADRNAMALRLRRMANHAPTVIGRGNHDKIGDLTIFELLEAEHPIQVFERPGIALVGGVQVFILPHFDKSQAAGLLPADLPIEQADDAMVQAVKTIFLHWKGELPSRTAAMDATSKEFHALFSEAHIATYPAVMIGHLTIAGSILSNGEPHPHQGVQLSIADLDQLGFDAVMLNHIHKTQACDAAGRIRYAGSLSRANFGEEDGPKGWLLWEIDERGAEPRVEFREVPARRMLTLDAAWNEERGGIVAPFSFDVPADAEIRLRVTVPEDHSAQAESFVAEMRKTLAHVHALKVEVSTTPVSRVRAGEIATAKTPVEKLSAFWGATETPDERTQGGVLAKLGELETEVAA